jgi:hypothetical protein
VMAVLEAYRLIEVFGVYVMLAVCHEVFGVDRYEIAHLEEFGSVGWNCLGAVAISVPQGIEKCSGEGETLASQ